MPFALQLGNLGSEVSRSLKWYGKNEKRFQTSFNRAREEFCDYFLNGNSWGTDPVKMQRYYDQFALLGRK